MCVCSPSSQSTGWSALHFAAERGDVTTTQSLIKAGANPLLKDKVYWPSHLPSFNPPHSSSSTQYGSDVWPYNVQPHHIIGMYIVRVHMYIKIHVYSTVLAITLPPSCTLLTHNKLLKLLTPPPQKQIVDTWMPYLENWGGSLMASQLSPHTQVP